MNHLLKVYKTQIILVCAAVFAFAVSACGDASEFGVGAAGSSPTPEPTATDAPAILQPEATPTNTPVPPATGHIVFVSSRDGQMNLYSTTPDGVAVTRLTSNASEDSDPRLSPDGTKIAFVSNVGGNTDIYILDLLSNLITRVTDSPDKDSAPSWSPDGQRLAFESFRDGNFEIYVTNIDGSNQIRLTNDPAGDNTPVWSPTSDEIAFTSNRFGNADLFLLSLNGTVDTLTTNPGPDSNPAWSPDGSRIAYQIFSSDVSQICLIDHLTKIQNCITQTMDVYEAPVWSPNGLWLAVTASQTSSITLFNAQDGSSTQIYQQGIEPLGKPAWSPDGLRLVFQAQVDGNLELFTALIATNEVSRITTAGGTNSFPVWTAQ